MIESAGGIVPFLCHVFLIFFGGFFALNFIFNKNFVKSNIGYESAEASYMGRPLGFLMLGLVLMFIATLFQVSGFDSTNEIFAALFIFLVLASIHGFALSFKILPTHDGGDWAMKQNIRPLIPLTVLLIRYFAL
jgi:hypothetical protein|tara:strand:- start:560 stop:961 length:402 start_codon:yes stop_codon:yes gene_type:complete